MAQFPEEVLLPIPGPLKALLEDDCLWILRRAKLVQLPAELTVEGLLRDFYFTCVDTSTEDDTNLQLLSEVLDGIKVYFDFTLFDHLLYGPEKEQHRALGMINPVFTKKQAASQNAPPAPLCDGLSGASGHETLYQCLPSQVYGFIHLLRLFVKLPDFLTRAQLPASHAHLLHLHCRDLLGYMCSRRQELFLETHYYETGPSVAISNSTNDHSSDHEQVFSQ